MPGALPEGFARHYRRSPLTDPWEPLYSRKTDEAVVLGLRAGPAHTNSRGFVHGGLVMALIDNAMGLSCGRELGGDASFLTASLTLNFTGVARPGQWLTFETSGKRVGGTLAFTQGLVLADGAPCAQASGVFRRVEARPRAA